jgi:hypothetical protein
MGIIGLASSIYTLGSRDSYLGWSPVSSRRIKNAGLRRIMDLAYCMAIPPYTYMLGGKLIATLALSDPVRNEFKRKYGDTLLGLVTTCASGLHCPIFNRIMIKPGGLYRRIGQTAGYSTVIFSPDSLQLAKRVASRQSGGRRSARLRTSQSIDTLRRALRACGVNPEPILRLGSFKGVYLATLSHRDLALLKLGKKANRSSRLPLKTAVAHWKTLFLQRRMQVKPIADAIDKHNGEDLLLTRRMRVGGESNGIH